MLVKFLVCNDVDGFNLKVGVTNSYLAIIFVGFVYYYSTALALYYYSRTVVLMSINLLLFVKSQQDYPFFTSLMLLYVSSFSYPFSFLLLLIRSWISLSAPSSSSMVLSILFIEIQVLDTL